MRCFPTMPKGAALTACAALYLLSLRAYYVGFFNDDAFYLIGARALLSGHYAAVNTPGAPPLPYLPGYPLLLAPLVGLFPGTFLPCQLLSVALTVGSLGMFWSLSSDLPPAARSAALALAALNPLTVSMSGTVLSDVPFLFLTGAVLLFARRVWNAEEPPRWAALGLLAGSACALRPSGGAIPLSLLLALYRERRWRPMGTAAGGALLALAPLFIFLQPGGFLYPREWLDGWRAGGPGSLLPLIWGNTAFYGRELFARTMFRWPSFPGSAFLAAAAVWAGAGLTLAGAAREKNRFALLFLAFYSAIHLLWTEHAGRYLLPILPLVFGLFFLGLERLGGGRAVRAALGLSLALCLGPLKGILEASLFRSTPLNTPPRRTLDWIARNTGPGDALAAELDGRLFLLSGRPTVRLPKDSNPAAFAAELRRRGARYALVFPDEGILRTPSGRSPHDPLEPAQLERRLLASGEARRVFADPEEGSAIFRLK